MQLAPMFSASWAASQSQDGSQGLVGSQASGGMTLGMSQATQARPATPPLLPPPPRSCCRGLPGAARALRFHLKS